jgi:homoserine O-succinyltransferase
VPIAVPKNYFPDDDPRQPPLNRWKSHAHLLFGNWINEIYQTTPYDLRDIGVATTDRRSRVERVAAE